MVTIRRDQVFISYSHRDKEWLERLQTTLRPLVRKQIISLWADTEIATGKQWRQEIEDALARTSVAVLLVTPDFLASDFIAEHELPNLLAARSQGLTVIWIPVKASLYEETEIVDYQAAHDPARPLESLTPSEQSHAFVAICKKIKNAAEAPGHRLDHPSNVTPEQSDGSASVSPASRRRNKISRRAFIKVGGLAGFGGILYYISSKDFFYRGQKRLFSKDFVRNSKTGVLHHTTACDSHLPAVSNRSNIQAGSKLEFIHKGKKPHIADLVGKNFNDEDTTSLIIDVIKDSPTSTHLYKYLISIWGKNKQYERIHEFLSVNIDYLESRLRAIPIGNAKMLKKYTKAVEELSQRKSRADYLARINQIA